MKNEKELDLLLKRNETEQLSSVNWNQLQSSISKKLDEAEHTKTSIVTYKRVFRVASEFVVAAAVVFIAVMITNNIPTKEQSENGDKGIVTFIENKDLAKVEILDFKEPDNKSKERSSWIIIRTSEQKVVDNGQSRDEADFACLM